MTRWIAIFDDDLSAGAVRSDFSQAHFNYLAQNAGKIRMAGGLQPGPDEGWVGGLWILDVESREEAARLCEGDPFFEYGLRKSYRLMSWGRAPCYGMPNTILV